MVIQTMSGDWFYGTTAVEIVRMMRNDSWLTHQTLDEYMTEAAKRVTIFLGRRLKLTGNTTEERAASFIAEALKAGLLSTPPSA